MEAKTINLSRPVTVNGAEVTEITVRPTTVGNEEDAMQMAISMKRGKNPLTVEMCLFAKSTKLPFDALRAMPSSDYVKIRKAVNEVNGIEEDEETEEDENPTTVVKS